MTNLPRKTWLALWLALWAGAAQAQTGPQPSAEPLPEPEFEEPRGPVSPPAVEPSPVPAPPPSRAPAAGPRIAVREYRVEGASVFTPEELAAATAPWTGPDMDTGAVHDAVGAITKLYADAGYVTSGAYLPDQEIVDGVVAVRVVEGRLAGIDVSGSRWYRASRVESRVRVEVSDPVNLEDVERALQLLIQEEVIERVSGKLVPGLVRGEAILLLAVEEKLPFEIDLGVANDKPPPIGSLAGHLQLADRSLTGFGDVLQGWLAVTGGLLDGEVRYAFPVNAYGTTLTARFRGSDSTIVEDPIASAADIDSALYTVGLGVRHPVLRTPRQTLWLGLLGERRWARTFFEGRGFSFSPGTAGGESDVSVLRFFGEWIARSRSDVLAARALVSLGIDALGATTNPSGVPDGEFVSLLGQFQWAHRFPERFWNSQLIVRGDVQWAADPLFPMEQIAVGGSRTVRGYRENQFVRDSGVIGSAELRVPVLRRIIGRDTLWLAPFADVAHVWSSDERFFFIKPEAETIASLGLGLRYDWADRVFFRVYWGGRLIGVRNPHDDLQDYGVYLSLRVRAL